MREKHFQAEIAASIDWLSDQIGSRVWYWKIQDTPKGPEQRFQLPKPFDTVLCWQGLMFAVELKMKHGVSVSFNDLRDVQDVNLRAAEEAGASAWVLVCFRTEFSKREATKRGQTSLVAAFALTIEQWVGLRDEATRGSIPLQVIEQVGLSLPRLNLVGGKTGWDLTPMLVAAVGKTEPQNEFFDINNGLDDLLGQCRTLKTAATVSDIQQSLQRMRRILEAA